MYISVRTCDWRNKLLDGWYYYYFDDHFSELKKLLYRAYNSLMQEVRNSCIM